MEISRFYRNILQNNKDLIVEDLRSDYPLTLKALARAKMKQNKDAGLLLSQLNPSNLELEDKQYYLEATLLLSQNLKDYSTMQIILSRLIQEFPGSFFGNLVQKEMYKRSKQWRSSYEHLQKCVAFLPENDTFQFESAALALRIKDNDIFMYHLRMVHSRIKRTLLTLESKSIYKIAEFFTFFCLVYFLKSSSLVFLVYWVIISLWIYCRSRYVLIFQDIFLRAIFASLLASLLKGIVWSNIF